MTLREEVEKLLDDLLKAQKKDEGTLKICGGHKGPVTDRLIPSVEVRAKVIARLRKILGKV
jgi:hypothetical protein